MPFYLQVFFCTSPWGAHSSPQIEKMAFKSEKMREISRDKAKKNNQQEIKRTRIHVRKKGSEDKNERKKTQRTRVREEASENKSDRKMNQRTRLGE